MTGVKKANDTTEAKIYRLSLGGLRGVSVCWGGGNEGRHEALYVTYFLSDDTMQSLAAPGIG